MNPTLIDARASTASVDPRYRRFIVVLAAGLVLCKHRTRSPLIERYIGA